MSCRCDDDILVDSNGCFHCVEVPKVKGRFGLAWVSESPECPRPEPVGWQVEFLDTPSKVEQKCQEMVRWINCPPLPRCDPCPPDELCSPCNPPRCNPCAPICNPCHPKCPTAKCSCSAQKSQMKSRGSSRPCCCCKPRQKRACFPPPGTPYCRQRSPRRRGGCSCEPQDTKKCTCDDVPVKDTNNGICSSSGSYTNYDTNKQYNSSYTYLPQQVTPTEDKKCNCLKPTVTLYRNQNQYNTDTEYSRNDYNDEDNDCNNETCYKKKPDGERQPAIPEQDQQEQRNPNAEATENDEGVKCICGRYKDDDQQSKNVSLKSGSVKSDKTSRQKQNASQKTKTNRCDCCEQINVTDTEAEPEPEPTKDVQNDNGGCTCKANDDKSDGKTTVTDFPDDQTDVENELYAGDPGYEEQQRQRQKNEKKNLKASDSVEEALRLAKANGDLDPRDPNVIELERILDEAERAQKQNRLKKSWLSPLLFRLCFKSRANDGKSRKPAANEPTTEPTVTPKTVTVEPT